MDTPTGEEPATRRRRLRGPAIGLLAAGGVAGLVLGFTGVASAQDSPTTVSSIVRAAGCNGAAEAASKYAYSPVPATHPR